MMPKCHCSNSDVITNTANGKDFFYCRGCKAEVCGDKPQAIEIVSVGSFGPQRTKVFVHKPMDTVPDCEPFTGEHHVQYPLIVCMCHGLRKNPSGTWQVDDIKDAFKYAGTTNYDPMDMFDTDGGDMYDQPND